MKIMKLTDLLVPFNIDSFSVIILSAQTRLSAGRGIWTLETFTGHKLSRLESFIPGLRPTRLGDPGSISIFLSLYIKPSKEQVSCTWNVKECRAQLSIVFKSLPDDKSYSSISVWPLLLVCSSTSERKRKLALHNLHSHIELNPSCFISTKMSLDDYRI